MKRRFFLKVLLSTPVVATLPKLSKATPEKKLKPEVLPCVKDGFGIQWVYTNLPFKVFINKCVQDWDGENFHSVRKTEPFFIDFNPDHFFSCPPKDSCDDPGIILPLDETAEVRLTFEDGTHFTFYPSGLVNGRYTPVEFIR